MESGIGGRGDGPSCVERQRFTTVLLMLPPPVPRRKGCTKAVRGRVALADAAAFAIVLPLLIPAMNFDLSPPDLLAD